MSVRLNKLLADSGLCSRREADRLIEGGRVRVNRKTVTALGTQVHPDKDKVTVDDKPLPQHTKRYIAFHKPRGYVTTRSDENNRATIYTLLPPGYHILDPAGRLDKDSSGLLILSNDGDFLYRITHPKFHVAKHYRITLNRILTPDALRQLKQGVLLMPENKLAKVASLEPYSRTPQEVVYTVVLMTGYNRQIRRSLEALGYPVLKLKRTALGPVKLGNLAPGKTRPLKPIEIRQLLGNSDKPDATLTALKPPAARGRTARGHTRGRSAGERSIGSAPDKGQKRAQDKNRPVKEQRQQDGQARSQRKRAQKPRPPKF